MRKTVLAMLAVFVALAMLAPPALAQAPAPKVTINGLIDNISSWSRNMSNRDVNYDKSTDSEWYARTRLRPDLTAEVGSTKFVFGVEIDYTWGSTGAVQRPASQAGAGLNTDMPGIIEFKWGYTEFDLPFIYGGRLRLGAQPFDTTYKLIFASGDFAGVHFDGNLMPGIKLHATYAQIEEQSTGAQDLFVVGEDTAWIFSVELSPYRGLDVRPIYSYAFFSGATNGAARSPRGGVDPAAFTIGDSETRHTIGVDARWKGGPFYLDPTVFFQFGERDVRALGIRDQGRQALLIDVRGGWQGGPLLVEAVGVYTTGNKAGDAIHNSDEDINFFEPLDLDTGFHAGWANIFALGIDYFNILRTAGSTPGGAIGYDKYGLFRVGGRGSYAMTPAFSVNAAAMMSWTAEEVDTGSTLTAGGLTPSAGASGDERYLGLELNLGATWRFAPNIAFDVVGAYLIAGDALAYANSSGLTAPAGGPSPDPEDVKTIAARVRYTF
jgi:hypothetical protein